MVAISRMVSAAVLCACATGCVSHDQVLLPNPNPCRVTCEHDYIAPLDPSCSGYHPTCWRAWCANCPTCPPPCLGEGAQVPLPQTVVAPEQSMEKRLAPQPNPESIPTPTGQPPYTPMPVPAVPPQPMNESGAMRRPAAPMAAANSTLPPYESGSAPNYSYDRPIHARPSTDASSSSEVKALPAVDDSTANSNPAVNSYGLNQQFGANGTGGYQSGPAFSASDLQISSGAVANSPAVVKPLPPVNMPTIEPTSSNRGYSEAATARATDGATAPGAKPNPTLAEKSWRYLLYGKYGQDPSTAKAIPPQATDGTQQTGRSVPASWEQSTQ